MNTAAIHSLVRQALREDRAAQDITTLSLIPARQFASARIIYRQEGTVCGHRLAREIFRKLDPGARYKTLVKDGEEAAKGSAVALIRAKTRAVLSGERTALNFFGRLGGIATHTHRFVKAVSGTGCAILDTRKTTPTLRDLERYAVRCGGGQNHRFDLQEMVMIKDNHRTACRPEVDIAGAIRIVRAKSRRRIVAEVDDLEELAAALLAAPDIILLDNMRPAMVGQAVAIRNRLNKSIQLEASGGITLRNVAHYAQAGVDRISLGALTHSAPAVDVSLELDYDPK
ncbi:MAG: carboxylating nicotinate-nucleotide diphosphorylase [Candidatus Omnitrophica bacterium]|nr:carboxylating nicotinate-nucleotide diphosphorylase [Candidatus Omnitrophota bacterium]MCB9721605.1 carboxylating nicotinate-nucleotide diphosphorylase [Candidatus Omnitrophota bacterium]